MGWIRCMNTHKTVLTSLEMLYERINRGAWYYMASNTNGLD